MCAYHSDENFIQICEIANEIQYFVLVSWPAFEVHSFILHIEFLLEHCG